MSLAILFIRNEINEMNKKIDLNTARNRENMDNKLNEYVSKGNYWFNQ